MEIVTAIVTPVVESLMVSIRRHIGYIFSYTNYVSDMGAKNSQLEAKILDVENHVQQNKINNFEVPAEVKDWLEKVAKIDAQVKSIPNNVGSCFSIKLRHKFGRKAFKITEEIDRFILENSMINWTDRPIPLGKVNSIKASTSTPSNDHNDFKSRERTFTEALKALQPDHKSQMIALCGMGGVGKTTMMENLKKVVEENKLFNLIVKVVIGAKMNTIAFQDAVADYLGICLTGKSESARSDLLHKSFEAHSDGGKNKILVILDDVWQSVHLNLIGLSPLPNQGDGFKFLLTSRDKSVCTMMGVEVNSIFKVDVMEEAEAMSFFQSFVGLSDDDHELHNIGENIVRRCRGLPIAIKTIAIMLKDKTKDAWRDAYSRLENHDIHKVVHEVFEMSYKNLEDEEIKSIFLLCGFFPEDFDIPIEDLLRYGWGLELFNKVYRITHARYRLNACIERLIQANLLIRSQTVGCVNMHDLVLDFVLDTCSRDKHTLIIGNISNWPTKLISDSCKRMSLSCRGMFELPRNFMFPKLSLLKLMHGNELVKFPKDFYENMKNLQVIAYAGMMHPLSFRSLQCSTNLRTLCLHFCLTIVDFSSIGDLLNLEVLRFSDCRIKELPSTIGNLKELKLLDLTGCVDLCIDDGVLKNLVKLEELYMRSYKVYGKTKKGIRFTDANRDELVECSKNLTSLEIEFFESNDLPNNISLKKLERFKISIGCDLEVNYGKNEHSFINTLMLVTKKGKLLDSKMNELFEKTEVLHLHVEDMNELGEVLVESLHHHHSSFYNLRVLHICECVKLRYLFTINVANSLTKLEFLEITSCRVLETLVDSDDGGVEWIKFQALKFLSLGNLPNLTSLCNDVNAIELPQFEELILENLPNFTSIYANSKSCDVSPVQSLLNKEVVLSQLKKLEIRNMEKLTEICPSDPKEFSHVDVVPWCLCQYFTDISIWKCDALSSVIPSYAARQMQKLENLEISDCELLVEIFESKGGCRSTTVDEGSGGGTSSTTLPIPRLKHIDVPQLSNLKTLKVHLCDRLEYVFTFSALESLMQLQELDIWGCERMKVIVKEEHGDQATSAKVVVFPRLKSIVLFTLPNLAAFFLGTNEFHCPSLDNVWINGCPQMTVLTYGHLIAPKLKYIHTSLGKLSLDCDFNNFHVQNPFSCIDGTSSCPATSQVCPWSFYNMIEMSEPYNDEHAKKIIPRNKLLQLQKLEEIRVGRHDLLEEIFEAPERPDRELQSVVVPKLREVELKQLKNLKYIWKNNPWMVLEFPNLTKLSIWGCLSMEHVFTTSMVGSLVLLEELHIVECECMEVIVKEANVVVQEEEERDDGKVNEIIKLPRLKFIRLEKLPILKGFCLGKEAFSWPCLNSLSIIECPAITILTMGHLTTPKLEVIQIKDGKRYIEEEDLNSFIKTAHEKELFGLEEYFLQRLFGFEE